jgi:NAD(P)-dependent dehydrogenase (short-subunit alcohol dehydrogenase family)
MPILKNIVITGASGQLGETFVNHLKNDSENFIYAVDVNIAGLQAAENVKPICLDVTNESDVVSFFASLDHIDVVINNAGIGVFSPFEERTVEDFYAVINVNMLGTFLMCRESVKKMKVARSGKIVNIGSIYGVVSSDFRIYGNSGRNNSEVYSMSKAGVIMLTKYLAANYAQYNIQVNAISPGGVLREQSADFLENYTHRTPAGHLADAKDLLSTLDYLIAENSSYVNGLNAVVDGGFTAW